MLHACHLAQEPSNYMVHFLLYMSPTPGYQAMLISCLHWFASDLFLFH